MFNAPGRFPRFKNSQLIFGDTLDVTSRSRLKLTGKNKTFYRKAAYHEVNNDSVVYFMYGVSEVGAMLKEIRIRSMLHDTVLDDQVFIDYHKGDGLSYDYTFSHDEFVVIARNVEQQTHSSLFQLNAGEILDKTFIPDSIFRRQDLYPDLNKLVNIYDDFAAKTLNSPNESRQVKGKITSFLCDDDCREFMIIDLLGDEFANYPFLLVERSIFNTTSVYGAKSTESTMSHTPCIRCGRPRILSEGKQLLVELAYIEYR